MSKKNIPVEKNKQYTGEVEDLTYEGLGVVKIDRHPIFVENALPGEKVTFNVISTGNKFSLGEVESIENPSADRVETKGIPYTQIGNMPLQHLAYNKQLDFKRQQLENNFQRTAHIEDLNIEDTLGMEEPYGYRNKVQIPVREVDGQLETGYYRKRSHDLVPLEDYIIHDPKIDEALIVVRDILRKYHIPAYDEANGTGDIRHIVIRRGYYTGEMMIVLVTNGKKLLNGEELVKEIKTELPEVVSIVQNINDKKTSMILGKDSKVLLGTDSYHDKLFDFTFEISHQSFYQVNPTQTEKLYQTAIDFADLSGDEVVIDAYCGIGTLTLPLAEKAKKVYGIEIVEDAIKNAKKNAETNGVDNVEFFTGAAERIIDAWAKDDRTADVIVVDPPKKGLDKHFVDAVLTMKPEKFVYVSCNPATLGRDVKILTENGYNVDKVQPVDMFPQTTQVESVTLLTRS